MKPNKNINLQTLKETNYQLQLSTEHVLTIILNNRVNISEVRKFLNHQYSENTVAWQQLSENEFENMARQCEKYIEQSRQEWKKKQINYPQYKQQAENIKRDLLHKIDIKNTQNNKELLNQLNKQQKCRVELMTIHMNTESEASIREQNQQIKRLIQLLENIVLHEEQHKLYNHSTDQAYYELIAQILRQSDYKDSLQQQSLKEKEQKVVIMKMEEYDRKLLLIKKRLYQIFLFYCRENNTKGMTFEKYNSSSHTIDLRLFLKYFKDYQFVEHNKYRFKVTKVTQMYRNTALNGLSMNFEQFWHVHRQMFELQNLNLTKMNIVEADIEQLPYLKQRWQEQIDKLRQINQIVSQERTKEIIKFSNLKTQESPQKTLRKNQSSVILSSNLSSKPSSKQSSQYLSRYHQKTQSQKDLFKPLQRKNFIQEIRQQIMNSEERSPKKNIQRSGSQYSISPLQKTGQVELSLPKILKLSKDQISSQDIYKSLKHFSNHEYIAQEQKIRDIIGLSNGEDDDYMRLFLIRERIKAESMKREKSIDRQIKRKQFLQSINKKSHRCKKLKVEDIEPYMRF